MHSIIIAVEKAAKDMPFELEKWQSFLSIVGNEYKPAKDTGRLSENLWLLHPESDAPLLAKVIAAAEKCYVPYRIIFVNKATESRYSPKPNSKAA